MYQIQVSEYHRTSLDAGANHVFVTHAARAATFLYTRMTTAVAGTADTSSLKKMFLDVLGVSYRLALPSGPLYCC